MKRGKAWLIMLCLLSGLACRLTSPTPASWSGTPTAQVLAQTETVTAQTAQTFFTDEPTEISLPTLPTEEHSTATPTPTEPLDGPWLVYPGPQAGTLQAYDVEAKVILDIELPQPIYFADLVPGRSPQGNTLVIRAGSPEVLDELALYQIDLPSTEVTRISPLLTLTLQRQIVNEESPRALETLEAVTRENGLSWSPNGRYLAFTAALDNFSSDLYLYDTLRQRVERLNGLYSHNGTPFWSPKSNWLISQELELRSAEEGWKSVNVTALRVPGYDDQNTLYLPPAGSQSEVFLGWTNAQNLVSFSQAAQGPQTIREVNVESVKTNLIFESPFKDAAFDPESKFLALIMDQANAAKSGGTAGIYGFQSASPNLQLIRAGDFSQVSWRPGGMFVAAGNNGVFVFPPEGMGFFLSKAGNASLSPNGDWLIAWGKSPDNLEGARLYQPPTTIPLQTLLESSVETAIWQPDSHGFLMLSMGTLFHFTFPSLQPKEVAWGFTGDIPPVFVWLE